MRAEMLALAKANFVKLCPDQPIDGASPFVVVDDPPLPIGEKDIEKALRILIPKPKEREDCIEDIRWGYTNVEVADKQHELHAPRSSKTMKTYETLLAALKRAEAAQSGLPGYERLLFKRICKLKDGMTFIENHQKHWERMPPRKGKSSHKQQRAVFCAYNLVELWLVRKQGIDSAKFISRQSAWSKLSDIMLGKKVNLLAHMGRLLDRLEA